MREALTSYATRAAEKMRRYKVAADNLLVFMHTNTFKNDPFYSKMVLGPVPSHDERHRRSGRSRGAPGRRLFREGCRDAKCSVMITALLPETVQQPALWSELDRERGERVWKTVDRLNATLGRGTVRILSAGPKNAAWNCGQRTGRRAVEKRWDELSRVLC